MKKGDAKKAVKKAKTRKQQSGARPHLTTSGT